MTIKRLVWKQEEKLLVPLEKVYGSQSVFTKVRMIDVISHSDRRLTSQERDYLFKAHFDFIIVDEEYNPILVIELDGAQHKYDKRQIERDKKKDAICKKAGITLIRITLDELEAIEDDPYHFTRGEPDEALINFVLFTREYFANTEFTKFVNWLNIEDEERDGEDFGYIITEIFSLGGLVEFVYHNGLTNAIQNAIYCYDAYKFVRSIHDEIGKSEEDWWDYFYDGDLIIIFITFVVLGMIRLSEQLPQYKEPRIYNSIFEIPQGCALPPVIEAYKKTKECDLLMFVFRNVLDGLPGGSTDDNLAFTKALIEYRVKALESIINLKNNHPLAVKPFIDTLGGFISGCDREETLIEELRCYQLCLKCIQDIL